MLFRQIRTVLAAIHAVYADSGFAMAGAVAFSFVLSLFPFSIFLGAMAGLFGGEERAKQGIKRLFEIVPAPVAEGLAPQLMEVMAVIISGVMSKAKTPDEALKEAQAKAEEIMAS